MRKRVQTKARVRPNVSVTIVEFPRGHGDDRDPVRTVRQVFDEDGTLLAEHDPITAEFLRENYFEANR